MNRDNVFVPIDYEFITKNAGFPGAADGCARRASAPRVAASAGMKLGSAQIMRSVC